LILALCCVLPANAQAPAPDPGVNPVRQIDRPEVRVTRVELQRGAVRSVHQHDDVRFHLFIPIEGKIELTVGSGKPVEAVPGQAYFMQRGTPHGFRNLGASPAAVMEVFVKEAPSAGRQMPPHKGDADSADFTQVAAMASAVRRMTATSLESNAASAMRD
jgi:quercetin dioxygenase-like cupin family protein